MKKLNDIEMLAVVGGWSITGTLINALVSAGKSIYSLGQSFGSSLRRVNSHNLCPIK